MLCLMWPFNRRNYIHCIALFDLEYFVKKFVWTSPSCSSFIKWEVGIQYTRCHFQRMKECWGRRGGEQMFLCQKYPLNTIVDIYMDIYNLCWFVKCVNLIKIISLTCSPLLKCRGVGDLKKPHRGRDCMVVRFTTTYVISAYHH